MPQISRVSVLRRYAWAASPGAALPRTNRLLMAARAARSVGQGAMVVDFALYLRALGWSAAQIGTLMMAALGLGVMLTLLVGPLSDRIGRKRLLIGYEAAYALAALAASVSSQAWVLVLATVVTGFGRGANGTAGPFAPAEQAWLAQSLLPQDRGRAYSLNSAVGFVGMALGALLSGAPAWLLPGLSDTSAYHVLFLVVVAGSLTCIGLLCAARDEPTPPPEATATTQEPARATRRQENGRLVWLTVANALQGAGFGMTGPLIAYWFALRFGHGPQVIGPLMSAALLLAALSSIVSGRLTGRFGIVPVVVVTSTIGLALTVALPLVPSFTLAATVYLVRSVFNRGTNGARQALSISLVRPSRRGLAASLSAASVQIPRTVGPALAGILYDHGMLILPFLIGATFQGGFIAIYHRSFRNHDLGDVRASKKIRAVSVASATVA